MPVLSGLDWLAFIVQLLEKRFVCSRNKQVSLRFKENYFTSFTRSWDSALVTPGNLAENAIRSPSL